MSNEQSIRDEIADEISGITVGAGYYSTTIGIDAAQEAADAIMPLIRRIQAERVRYRDLTRRTELQCQDAEAEADRLHKAITEALAEAAKGDNRMSDVQRILRAALDKEGNDDE